MNKLSSKSNLLSLAALVSIASLLTACYTEDPGPIQHYEKQFSVVDFDRVEIGDALKINIEQSNLFKIIADGDRRNVEDLIVEKEGTTLVVRFDEYRNRRHNTEITIKMPVLLGATLSGATDSKIRGFEENETLDIRLSGASVCQLDVFCDQLDAVVSGASYLYLYGEGQSLVADLSGASVLKAFRYPVVSADIKASGASDGNVSVSGSLHAIASGASVILYRGNPTVTSDVSGSSTVRQDLN
jgi:hypothetical protein